MGVGLPVPDYTTVSRRQAGLALGLGSSRTRTPRHVVIDTTGLKVFGAGEWYVRKHGMGKDRRSTWRKLHLGVDEASKEIVAVDLTASGVHDARICRRCWIVSPTRLARCLATAPTTVDGAIGPSWHAVRYRRFHRGGMHALARPRILQRSGLSETPSCVASGTKGVTLGELSVERPVRV